MTYFWSQTNKYIHTRVFFSSQFCDVAIVASCNHPQDERAKFVLKKRKTVAKMQHKNIDVRILLPDFPSKTGAM